MAKGLKDTLAAAGLSGSFDTLVGCIDDPVKMVGKAIHEAKAEADENGDQTRQIMDKEKPNTSLSAKDIYAKRQVKTK
jgi:ABC-type nitrate/sulfonate/bicarbonate transport system substrate-binding protein